MDDVVIQDWERRREEDRLLIERLLIIIRNVLHVPPNVAQELVCFLLYLSAKHNVNKTSETSMSVPLIAGLKCTLAMSCAALW